MAYGNSHAMDQPATTPNPSTKLATACSRSPVTTKAATGRGKLAAGNEGTRMSSTGLLRAFQATAPAPAISTTPSAKGCVPIRMPARAGTTG